MASTATSSGAGGDGTRPRSSILSLEDQFTFYTSYHSNRINKAIHLVCIWPIVWSGLALLTQLPLGKLPAGLLDALPLREEAWNLHAGSLLLLAYVVIYCAMDPFAGGLASIMMLSCYVTSNLWMADGGSATMAAAANLTGWIAQFYGHGAHEGRAPALLDNLFQAFLAAPLFVLCEVLFELGYRPEMHKRVQAGARLNIEEFQAAKMLQKAGGKAD